MQNVPVTESNFNICCKSFQINSPLCISISENYKTIPRFMTSAFSLISTNHKGNAQLNLININL